MWDTAELMRETLPDPSNPYLRVANTAGTRNEIQTPSERRYEGLKSLEIAPQEIQVLEDLEPEAGIRSFIAEAAAAKMRVDAYLAKALPHVSRGRVQLLIENGQVTVNGTVAKASHKLRGGEQIDIEGDPQPAPLRAEPEDLPLDIVYEDDDLAVINKAAGMTVHAGAGSLEDNRGTLVNALLFHFGKQLSTTSGDLRPGIVHRIDKQTSGLIVVAKNDLAHRKLAESFAERDLRKVYIALVHGNVKGDEGTIDLPISRDLVRRTRMTTRRAASSSMPATPSRTAASSSASKAPTAASRCSKSASKPAAPIRSACTCSRSAIPSSATRSTALRITSRALARSSTDETLTLDRNFLHAAELDLTHPRTGKPLEFRAPLPIRANIPPRPAPHVIALSLTTND